MCGVVITNLGSITEKKLTLAYKSNVSMYRTRLVSGSVRTSLSLSILQGRPKCVVSSIAWHQSLIEMCPMKIAIVYQNNQNLNKSTFFKHLNSKLKLCPNEESLKFICLFICNYLLSNLPYLPLVIISQMLGTSYTI